MYAGARAYRHSICLADRRRECTCVYVRAITFGVCACARARVCVCVFTRRSDGRNTFERTRARSCVCVLDACVCVRARVARYNNNNNISRWCVNGARARARGALMLFGRRENTVHTIKKLIVSTASAAWVNFAPYCVVRSRTS